MMDELFMSNVNDIEEQFKVDNIVIKKRKNINPCIKKSLCCSCFLLFMGFTHYTAFCLGLIYNSDLSDFSSSSEINPHLRI